MNMAHAVRMFIAAQDDPVLAAWASVAHEYKMSPMTDVSPYEYWEAYQEFYSLGLISPEQYNGVDSKQVFFSGRRPPASEIQRVLDNLQMLPEHQPTEPHMTTTKTRAPSDMFGDNNDAALVTKERETSVVGSRGHALPPQRASPGLNPFGSGESLRQGSESIPLGSFGQTRTLFREPEPTGRHLARSENTNRAAANVQIFCCGQELAMTVADMQADGPDAIPGGQISVIDAVLHGTCPSCEREHHHSVGEVVRHDEYR